MNINAKTVEMSSSALFLNQTTKILRFVLNAENQTPKSSFLLFLVARERLQATSLQVVVHREGFPERPKMAAVHAA